MANIYLDEVDSFSIINLTYKYMDGTKIKWEKSYHWYKNYRAPKQEYVRIASELNCGHYTIRELTLFIAISFMMTGKRVNLRTITRNVIRKELRNMSRKKLLSDKEVMKKLLTQLELKSVYELYDFNSNGDSIMYNLVHENIISYNTYLRFAKYIRSSEERMYESNKQVKQFHKKLKRLIQLKRGPNYGTGQEEQVRIT